jgi:hypothetical protein
LFDTGELGLYAISNYAGWSVDLDDQHVIMMQSTTTGGGTETNRFVMVRNWIEEIRDRVKAQ